MRDDQGAKYVATNFDLKAAYQFGATGDGVEATIEATSDEYCRITLSLTPETTTRIHFAISLVKFDNAIIYSGRAGNGVFIRDVRIDTV